MRQYPAIRCVTDVIKDAEHCQAGLPDGRWVPARALGYMSFAPWPPTYQPPKEEADGWSEWQAWDLMREFGRHLGMGFGGPFETEIFIGSLAQLRASLTQPGE